MNASSPKSEKRPLTVIGVGNILCTDDGLGPTVVSRMAEQYSGEGVTLIDGGTLGLSLLPILDDSERMILVDAVRLDAAPGSFVKLEADDVLPAVRLRLSPHQVGVADLLDAARLRGTLPEQLILLGLVPESIELGYGLSDPVMKGIPELVNAVIECCAQLGFPLERRSSPSAAHPPAHRDRSLVWAGSGFRIA